MLNLCAYLGCSKLWSPAGLNNKYCHAHISIVVTAPKKITAEDYELVCRLKRNKRLRGTMLPTVAADQGQRCANPLKACYSVYNGAATSRCPFLDHPVPEDVQQLDHIVPYCQTQDDCRDNLLMVCACCYVAKSMAEARDGAYEKEAKDDQEACLAAFDACE